MAKFPPSTLPTLSGYAYPLSPSSAFALSPKIPGFQLTLLVFVGQVFTGILLDTVAGSYQTGATLWGGMIIAAGIAVNMILERVIAASKKTPYSS